MLVVGAWSRSAYIYELSNAFVYDLLYTTADADAGEVCVSGDGSTVGVTSTTGSGARIFVRDGNAFQQRGSSFTGYSSRRSGIALNYDATIAAIGHHTWSSYRGRVSVFEWRDVGKEEKKGILSENVNRPNVCASEGLRRDVTWADVVRSK